MVGRHEIHVTSPFSRWHPRAISRVASSREEVEKVDVVGPLGNSKKLVQIFSEGMVKMALPVLVAISLMSKVDTKSMEEGLMRVTISPLAGVTMISAILLSAGESCRPFHVSNKVLIRLCGLLLMALASNLLLIVSMEYVPVLCVPILGVAFIACHVCFTWEKGELEDTKLYRDCEEKLETSVDFSVTIALLLFLALEGLALGGAPMHKTDLATTLLLTSFFFCIAGVLFMTVYTVPPLIVRADQVGEMLEVIEVFNRVLGVGFAAIVVMIAYAATGSKLALLYGAVVVVLPLLVRLYNDNDDKQTIGDIVEDVTPASLDLMKVLFPGFLAISAHALGNDTPISSDRRWFLLFTATALHTCLVWRLITHQTQLSPVWLKTCTVVSFVARLLLFAATVTSVIIALKVLDIF